jgi:hypothetical protein
LLKVALNTINQTLIQNMKQLQWNLSKLNPE